MPASGLEVAAAAFALANSALEGIFKISDRVATQLGVEHDLAFIHDEFAMMQAFLEAADDRRRRDKENKVAETWVQQVRVLANEVDDFLEDSTARLWQQSSWLRLPRTVKARRRIADGIRQLRAKVEDVSNRNKRYRLINDGGATTGFHDELSSSRSAAIPLAANDDAHQRQSNSRPEASLAHLLISGGGSGSALQVISVWGRDDHARVSAAVVREAYDNPETEKSFEWLAWVKVAHPFSPHEFVKSLLRHFDGGDGDGNSSIKAASAVGAEAAAMSNAEEDKFERLVKEKRYLFVLDVDDLVDAEVWLLIKKRLYDAKNGSRIIVRAQHQGIAMLCPKQPIQVLRSKIDKDYESLYGHPPPPIYLIFTKGLEQSGSEQGARSNSRVAGESSGSTVEPKPKEEGQHNSGTIGQQDDLRGSLGATLEENVLVGRDSDACKLIDLILSDKAKRQENPRSICVFGASGIGKTALVKSIWQSGKLHGTFERLAWVTMQENISYHEVINTVLQQLDSKRKKTDSTWLLSRPEPDKTISAKGILLVLDDVSSKKDWDVIKSALPEFQDKVSQVIITTEDPSIAQSCENSYNLPPLQHRYSLELLKKKVKVDLDGENLSKVANEIVVKCGGIPQVVITVALSLQEKPVIIEEWEMTRDHLSAELVNNPKRDNILLTFAFKNLPSNLRSCFLYLSVFPNDNIIRRRRLVKRWIADGYSTEKHGRNAEEVADKQFQDLISRNMIQPSRTTTSKIGTSGETYFFEFTNQIHSISRRISAEENHVLVLDEDEHRFQSKCRTHHLTVMSDWSREEKNDALESVVDLSCLRSLTVFGEFKSFFISKKMRLLRVLDLEDTYGLRSGDLSSICKLYNLRYLSLRGSKGIFHLPISFGNLPFLETLDVRDTSVTKLPSSIVKLKKLKYLRAGIIAYDEDESCNRALGALWYYWYMISEVCFSKEPISDRMEELDLKMLVPLIWLIANVWLRGLDPHGVKVPRGIGKLKFLQTLGVVNVARGKNVLKKIKKLTQLRKLGVTGINRNNCKELVSAISNGHLQSLSMRAEGKVGLDGCLDEMSPPKDLQSLKLYGNLGKLPGWIGKLQSLVKLTLRSTLLKQDAIEILGKLENLATLRFQEKSFKDEEVNFPC